MDRTHRDIVGICQTYRYDGEMSTSSKNDVDDAGNHERQEAGLALGVEINALLSASRALTERTAAAFHPDLQPAAFHLARWLYAYGPANPSALASAVAMDRGSTSNLIGRMKALGLVQSTPDPVDRRAVKISLTDAGVKCVVEALDLRGASFFSRIEDWAVEDIKRFTALLNAFNAPRNSLGTKL